MRQLYFINLSLDQLYDTLGVLKKLFPIRVPRSEALVRSNEDFAYLLTNTNDTAFQYSRPEPWIDALWRKSIPHLGSIEVMKSNPYDWQDWIQEFNEIIKAKNLKYDGAFVCGVSFVEEEINKKIPLSNVTFSQQSKVQVLNKKTKLPEIMQELSVDFPESRTLTSSQLISELEYKKISSEYLIKASYGSGGGANFSFESMDSSFAQYFLNFLKISPVDFEWLIQKKLDRHLDFAFVGDTSDESGEILEIIYDHLMLSNEHKVLINPTLRQKILSVASDLRSYLLKQEYRGPFGFDGILTQQGKLYPVIDLNVRWTKSHYFVKLVSKLNIRDPWVVIRERFVSEKKYQVEKLIEDLTQLGLQLGIKLFFPINISGLFQGEPGKSEFTYLLQADKQRTELFKLKCRESLEKL